MATMTMPLPLAAMTTPDDAGAPTTHVIPAAPSAPRETAHVLRFDRAPAARAWIVFQLPTDYAAAPALRVGWCSASTAAADACVWVAAIEPSTSPPEAPAEPGPAGRVAVVSGVDAQEARREVSVTIALPADERLAPGLPVAVLVARDAAAEEDTLAGAADLLSATLHYTTTAQE